MLAEAFNALLNMHSRSATLKRYAADTTSATTAIRITPSNYFRNLEGPSQVTIEGREFVISRASFASPMTPYLKKGDRIIDADFGTMTVDEIQEMFDLGGAIIGYRVRCE